MRRFVIVGFGELLEAVDGYWESWGNFYPDQLGDDIEKLRDFNEITELKLIDGEEIILNSEKIIF